MTPELITVSEAAKLKQVTRATVYQAVQKGRLPHQVVLGHIGLKKTDVLAWQPGKQSSGRPKGIPVSAETKRRISEGQKQRWAARKKRL